MERLSVRSHFLAPQKQVGRCSGTYTTGRPMMPKMSVTPCYVGPEREREAKSVFSNPYMEVVRESVIPSIGPLRR